MIVHINSHRICCMLCILYIYNLYIHLICLGISLIIFYLSVQDFSRICSKMINEHHQHTHTYSYIQSLLCLHIHHIQMVAMRGCACICICVIYSCYFAIWQKLLLILSFFYFVSSHFCCCCRCCVAYNFFFVQCKNTA